MAMLLYYKNDFLIDSLSAQIFAGLLKEVSKSERHDEISELKSGGSGEAELSAVVAKGKTNIQVNGSSSTADSDSRDETIIPHDARVLEVLKALEPSMKTDLAQATRGDIVKLKGSMFFLPKTLEKMSKNALSSFIDQLVKEHLSQIPKDKRNLASAFIKGMVNTENNSSLFIFKSDNDYNLSGFLETGGFCENSMSLFMKYEASLIPCEIVAVYETHEKNKPCIESETLSLYEILNQMAFTCAQVWSQGMPESQPVTPIVIYQKINQ